MGLIAPAAMIVLGIVLGIGWLALAGISAYSLLIVVGALSRVARHPETGYGLHTQFRQGHRSDVEYINRDRKRGFEENTDSRRS